MVYSLKVYFHVVQTDSRYRGVRCILQSWPVWGTPVFYVLGTAVPFLGRNYSDSEYFCPQNETAVLDLPFLLLKHRSSSNICSSGSSSEVRAESLPLPCMIPARIKFGAHDTCAGLKKVHATGGPELTGPHSCVH